MSHDPSPPPTRAMSGTFSDRSLSQDSMEMMEESDGIYRSSESSRRNARSYRNYESDYDDQRFSSSSSSRYRPEYRPSRERPHHTAPALESRRRMFEREQQREGRWDHEYSDSYSDVEFKRHHYNNTEMPRDRARERERERVSEFKRFFQQKGSRAEDFRSNKPSMRRQDSSTSQESSFNRHYPEGLFEMYRSRFEVLFFISRCIGKKIL